MKTSLKTVFLMSAVAALSGCPDSGSKSNAGAGAGVHAGQCNYDVTSAYNSIRNSGAYGNHQYVNQECNRLQSLLGTNTCDMPLSYGSNNGYNNGYSNNGYPNTGYPTNSGYPNNGYPNNGYPNNNVYPNAGTPNNTTTTASVPTTKIAFADVQSICTAAGSGTQPNPIYPNPTIPGQPGNPGQPNVGIKNFSCRLQVRNGNVFGDTGPMSIPAAASGGQYDLFAYVVKNQKLWNIFNYTSISTSQKYGKMKLTYIPANGLDGDRMELRASGVDGYKSASIAGFAGQEMSLEIAPKDEFSIGTYISLSCVSSDATNPGPMISNGTKYTCRGEEKQGSKVQKFGYANDLSDLLDAGLSLTRKLYVQGEGSVISSQGSVQMNYDMDIDSNINTRSYLGTATQFTASNANSGQSVKVNCRITQ